MDRMLLNFVKVLRGADIRISVAESIDAMHVVHFVGYRDRELLKNALGQTLAKTAEAKELFDYCFERYFSFDRFAETSAGAALDGTSAKFANVGDAEVSSALGAMLLNGDRGGLAVAMAEAAQGIGIDRISLFTQSRLFTRRILDQMGLSELLKEISLLSERSDPVAEHLAEKLEEGVAYLFSEVGKYVDQQVELYSAETTRRVRERHYRKTHLSQLEHTEMRQMHELVQKMAKRLATLYGRRRKRARRGQLDLRKTLRENLSHDGLLFNIKWKTEKVGRPKVYAICDVSGSVQTAARFLLMFLHSLDDVLPKVRSFAFSGTLTEVTGFFDGSSIEEAIPRILHQCGNGSTDYGAAFIEFKRLCLKDLDQRSTVIILGDGRNNYSDPRADILQEIYRRSKQVIWLNPETRGSWRSGDGEMHRLAPYCHKVEVCSSLGQLERLVSDLCRTAV